MTNGPTLEDAKQWLRDRIDDGARCPCCTQLAKVYKRRVHSTMARELITIYRASPECDWLYLPDVLRLRGAHGGDTVKATYWGLIEEDDDIREDGSSRTGWWRLTEAGRGFVLGEHKIPKYARVYDGRLLGFEGEMATIRDALGAKFDYDLLMKGQA